LTTLFALLALGSCCAFAPAASASSTLLSGYGGPGQGNQAILGSTLIGGSGGSGGGGGSGGSGSAAPQTASIEASPAPQNTPGAGAAGTHSGGGTPQAHPRRHAATPTSTAAGATAPAKAAAVRSVSAPALGLSGTDIAYVVAGFLILMLTAVVTVLLTRGERPAQGGRGEIDSH
jgi:hypothetical protein